MGRKGNRKSPVIPRESSPWWEEDWRSKGSPNSGLLQKRSKDLERLCTAFFRLSTDLLRLFHPGSPAAGAQLSSEEIGDLDRVLRRTTLLLPPPDSTLTALTVAGTFRVTFRSPGECTAALERGEVVQVAEHRIPILRRDGNVDAWRRHVEASHPPPPARAENRYPCLALDDEPEDPRTCVLCGLWVEADRVEGTCRSCAIKAAKVSGFWSPGSAPRRRETSPAVARPRNRSQVRSRKSPSPSRPAGAPAPGTGISSHTSEEGREGRAGRPTHPVSRQNSAGSHARGNLGATAGPSDPGKTPSQAPAPMQQATSSKPPLQPVPPPPPPSTPTASSLTSSAAAILTR